MTRTIPLIRAANVLPLVRFLEANGEDAMGYLEAADLGYWFALAPEDPVPMLNAVAMLRDIARTHGPDVGTRIVSQASVAELAFIGRVALGARTPAEAMKRVAMAIPLHSSHEMIRAEPDRRGQGFIFTDRITAPIDAESLHAVHVLLCSMVRQIGSFTGLQSPLLARIEAQPHPEVGLEDLARHFGAEVRPSRGGVLRITLAAHVAMNPFRFVARDRIANARPQDIPPLAEDATLSGSVRPVIAAMLHGGEPTIERVARAGGMSIRTMQRRLSEEGTSFSAQIDQVRRALAVALLQSQDMPLEEMSERLGYASRATLSRAVRRLVGNSPTHMRQALQN